jgi:hypothetical protein
MLFAVSADDGELKVFPDELPLYRECEIDDVDAGLYLFFDDSGQPLAAVVTPPEPRRFFTLRTPTYVIQPTTEPLPTAHFSHSSTPWSARSRARRHWTPSKGFVGTCRPERARPVPSRTVGRQDRRDSPPLAEILRR